MQWHEFTYEYACVTVLHGVAMSSAEKINKGLEPFIIGKEPLIQCPCAERGCELYYYAAAVSDVVISS